MLSDLFSFLMGDTTLFFAWWRTGQFCPNYVAYSDPDLSECIAAASVASQVNLYTKLISCGLTVVGTGFGFL
jgi:hypothetical protein